MTWADLVSLVMPLLSLVMQLLGVVIGGLIAYFVASAQNRHQARMEAERRFVGSAERLHAVLGSARDRAGHLNLAMMFGLTSPADAVKHIKDLPTCDIGSLNMLVDYYAPQLRGEADEIEAGISTLASLAVELVRTQTPAEREQIAERSIEAEKRVKLAVQAAKVKLNEIVGPHTRLQS